MRESDKKFLFFGGIFLGLYALVSVMPSQPLPQMPPPEPTCKTDWKLCADNSELANNWSDLTDAEAACIVQTRHQAKYGEPEYPRLAFQTFINGSSAKDRGTITLVEKEAIFTNAFNAKLHHVRVECDYDLNAAKVLKVTVLQ